jgi:hypothetical protein
MNCPELASGGGYHVSDPDPVTTWRGRVRDMAMVWGEVKMRFFDRKEKFLKNELQGY